MPLDVTETSTPEDISAQIGKELFSSPEPSAEGGESGIEVSKAEGGESSTEVPSAEAKPLDVQSEIPQAPAVPKKALPKAWKKDMEPHWEKLDPAVQDYAYEREANVMRGLQQYQSGHERWNEVLQPFQHVLQQHPDVNPVPLLKNLMTNHLSLLQSPMEQKVKMVRDLIKGYGIDLKAIVPQEGETFAQPDPEILSLKSELSQIQQHLSHTQRTAYEAGVAEKAKEVSTFFADSKNEYIEDPGVQDDILRFLKSGAADSLPSAYELACYANPAVRAKMLAKQQVTPTPEKPKPTNVESSGQGKPRKAKAADWRSGVDSIISKHYGSSH
jgi:hypothetical protein